MKINTLEKPDFNTARKPSSLRLLAFLTGIAFQALVTAPASADIVAGSVATGPFPYFTVFNPTTQKLYVGSVGVRDSGGNVILPGKLTVLDSKGKVTYMDQGGGVFGLAINKTTKRLYVLTEQGLNVIDTDTNQVLVTLLTGDGPMVFNETNNKLYITYASPLSATGKVTIVDGSSYAITTIPFNARPGIPSVNPVTNKIYIPFSQGSTVGVLDGATNVMTTVAVPQVGEKLLVNPATNRIYLGAYYIDGATNSVAAGPTALTGNLGVAKLRESTNTLYFASLDTITAVDGVSHAILSTASTASGLLDNWISGIDFNETTNRMYVSQWLNDNPYGTILNGLVAFDASSNNVLQRLSSPPKSYYIHVDSLNNKTYTIGHMPGEIGIVDGKLDPATPVTPLPGGSAYGPDSVAINTQTNTVYAASPAGNSITAMNGITNFTSTINVGGNSKLIAFNEANGKIYVVVEGIGGNAVKVIESNGTVSATIPVGLEPRALQINPITNKIYVANSESDSVTVINGANNTASTIIVGNLPESIGINKTTNTIYVRNCFGQSISVINGATNSVAATIPNITPVLDLLYSVFGINEITNKIYLATYGKLYVIDGATYAVTELDGGDMMEQTPGRPIVRVDETTNTAYATNRTGKITVVNGATNALSFIPLPSESPYNIANMTLDTASKKLLVANYRDNSVTTVDLSNSGTAVVGIDYAPSGAAFNPVTRKFYVASTRKNSMSEVHDVIGQWTYQAGGYTYTYSFYNDHTYQAKRSTDCPHPCTPVNIIHQGGYVLNKGRYGLMPDFQPSRLGLTVNGNFLTGSDFGASLVLQRTP